MPRLLRIALYGLFLAAVLWAPVRLLARGELGRYRRLRAELGELRERNESHQHELNRLRLEVRALQKDRRAIERIARDELGLVREGEIILDFTSAVARSTPPEGTAAAAAGDPRP